MKTNRNATPSASLVLSAVAVLLNLACKEAIECGPGTEEVDGRCEPMLVCGPGTVPGESEGNCVPVCGPDEHFDEGECRPVARCAPGTFFDDDTGICRPDGSACAPGTTFDPVHMVCRPDVTACGEGTHPDGQGACVLDRLPEPDVTESSAHDGIAHFDLPEEGETVSLGGVVDLPFDRNEDGFPDQDWDVFAFSASAGDHIRVLATSEGACLPAFILNSEERDDDGYPVYNRASVNPHGVDNGRDFYLPMDGVYLLFVSDIGPVLGAIFGAGTIPVGGDEFSYFITVERLPPPTVQSIDSLPAVRAGSLENGRLDFFEISGIEARDILSLESAADPSADDPSDVFAILTIFDSDGTPVSERWARRADEDLVHFVAAHEGGSYLVVQDFLLSVGPVMGYSLELGVLPVQVCDDGACTLDSLPEGGRAVMRFDTSSGDLIVASGSMPDESEGRLRFELHDNALGSVAICSAGAGESCWRHLYVTSEGWYYVWVTESGGAAIPSFTLDVRAHSVPELTPGQDSEPLPVALMPADSMPDGGLARVEVPGDQVLFVDGIWHSEGWEEPSLSLVNRHLMHVGPPRDLESETLAPLQEYPLVWAGQEQTVLLRYIDEAASLQGATWGLTPHLLLPEDLGQLTATPIVVEQPSLLARPRVTLYRLEVADDQELGIVLAPEEELHPEIWVMARGWHSQGNWYYSAGSNELGLVASAVADSPGETLELDMPAPYNGALLILVSALNEPGDSEGFAMTVGVP